MSPMRAVFRQNLSGYFRNPTGWVFVALFVLVGALAQFWGDDFFPRNLDNLDPLNAWMPYLLLFFIPAVTMGAWAEERKHGTDELLLTLPASDLQIVLGKFLACLGIYVVALVLSASHVVVLRILGHPDFGLMASNYLGYALLGAPLLAAGMLGSLLTESMTVGFIFGTLLAAALVFASQVGSALGASLSSLGAWAEAPGAAIASVFARMDLREAARDPAGGVISLASAGYCLALTCALLYANLALLGRRRWGGAVAAKALHRAARIACAVAIAVGLHVLGGRVAARVDMTAERLHSLSTETERILAALPEGKTVYIQAYVSPKVPTSFVQTREALLGLLREFVARGGGRVKAQVYDAEAYSPEARDAEDRFGIRPEKVSVKEEGKFEEKDVFLGVAFTCGAEEVVLPFLHRGLPVEYELTRSIRVVTRAKRLRVGVLRTDANLLGGFDFERMTPSPPWSIVDELKRQYEVVDVNSDSDYPEGLDCLLAALPSSLTQPQLDRLVAYVTRGKAALLLDDPMPAFNIHLAPREPKGGPQNPFQQQRRPPEKKGKVADLYDTIGVRWPEDQVAWSRFNPHPQFHEVPPEVIFVAAGNGAREPFCGSDSVTSGLQEVALLFPGRLENAGRGGVRFTPLLAVGEPSGYLNYDEIVQRDFLGRTGLAPDRHYAPTTGEKILAARVEGTLPDEGKEHRSVKAIVVADVDVMSEQFFDLRRQGSEELNFDNVTFVLNAVDSLAGDETYLPIRKRRPMHRTLETVEERTRTHRQREVDERNRAEQEAKDQVGSAQKRLDEKVAVLRGRTDLSEREREAKMQNLEEVENRRLEVEKTNIEDRKQREIERSRYRTEQEIRAVEQQIKWMSLFVFPVPAFVLALLVLAGRKALTWRATVQEEGR